MSEYTQHNKPGKIYRVELVDGTGMYWDTYFRDALSLTGDDVDSPRHPIPSEDAGLHDVWYEINIVWPWRTSPYKFGFVSIEQFKFWVYKTEWRGYLNGQGFVLSEYDCPERYVGDTQGVYHPATAVLVNRWNLMEV